MGTSGGTIAVDPPLARIQPEPRAETVTQAGEVRLARLESLRGIGVLGVLLGHAWVLGQAASGNGAQIADTFVHRLPLSGGYGLSLFFALSGYLLYWPFAQRDFGRGGRVDVRTYARNRAFRILPLYYVVLVVIMIAQEHGGSFSQWWRFALFAENFSTSTVGTVDGPMWSLVVELHFYILLPLIAWLVARLARGRREAGAILVGAAGLVAFALHWRYVANTTAPDLRKEYSLPTQFGFLAAGMLVAIARTAWRDQLPRWVRGPLLRSELWLVAAFGLWLVATNNYRYAGLTAIGGALVVGACVLPVRSGPMLRALDWRGLAFLGVVSYSFYLWHFPLFNALDGTLDSFPLMLAFAGTLSIIIAFVSYRAVEEPFLRLRRRWSPDAPAHRNPG